MKPFAKLGSLTVVLGCALAAHTARASGGPLDFMHGFPPHPFIHSSEGYLGVDLKDVGSDAAALKLKDKHGAEVVAIDHDAPAAKVGLKAHDVILQMNGVRIGGCDQLRRMLRKTAPGRSVNLLISRSGYSMTMTVQLADRLLLQHQAWSQHFSVQQPDGDVQEQAQLGTGPQTGETPAPTPTAGSKSFLASNSSAASHFLGTLIPTYLYVGADVNPVRTQLADYFGVTSGTGLLVENVDSQSPASRAGLRAGDVILTVNSTPMATRIGWFRALRSNHGKLVQVTIMRDKQKQTLTMAVGKLKKSG